jgi:hypothetical protein
MPLASFAEIHFAIGQWKSSGAPPFHQVFAIRMGIKYFLPGRIKFACNDHLTAIGLYLKFVAHSISFYFMVFK